MIKLRIKKLNRDTKTVTEEIIDFDGDFKNGFIVQGNNETGTLSWKPILNFDGWEPIEKYER
jgi:hypothetical protein